MTLKASRSPILSMTTYDNLLITSGTKSINIWDQENSQLVADLSNPNYLQSFVKSVISIPQYSHLAAACDKQVFIWDVRLYDSIAILKSHKD
jgi:WD40 repeat protein